MTRTHTRTHVFVSFANPYLVCEHCRGPVIGWHDNDKCGCGGACWNTPCGCTAGVTSTCPSWGPVDGCTCRAREVLADNTISAERINHDRENDDHNTVTVLVAHALDREGLTWEQVEEVTDACLTYVENHHGLRCPAPPCPTSYRGANAESDLIKHYIRAHPAAAESISMMWNAEKAMRDPDMGPSTEQEEG